MKFSVASKIDSRQFQTLMVDCIVVGVTGGSLSGSAIILDSLCHGGLSEALELTELGRKPGDTYVFQSFRFIASRRVMMVQLGDGSLTDFEKAALSAAEALKRVRCRSVLWCLTMAQYDERKLASSVYALRDKNYSFDHLKSQADAENVVLDEVTLLVEDGCSVLASQTLARARATSSGIDLCRDLGNLPPNICTPEYLAGVARTLAASPKVDLQVLEREALEALKMEAFLCVAKGSTEAPKFIVLRYVSGPEETPPVVLVGKGITFDSGGISIKPGDAMDEMKYDMCGAASVLGTLKAVIEMDLPLSVYVVIPTCENMPAGNSVRPGDIVTSMSGKTIEVLNTDAEGRLILCDALTYVERFKPRAVIDVATLTGACVVALGDVHSGLFAREADLADRLLAASAASNDTVWRMPLDAIYQESLKSNFADLQNIGGRSGGSITAACFLENFTRGYPWAHLDIAGTAWKSGVHKGATGRPVKLLTQYLVDLCQDSI